jgi:integrase
MSVLYGKSQIRIQIRLRLRHGRHPLYSPHDLRHRFASMRMMAGWPSGVTARALGHTKRSVTEDTYSHVLTEEPDWLLDQLREHLLRGGSVEASRHPAGLQNDERPA